MSEYPHIYPFKRKKEAELGEIAVKSGVECYLIPWELICLLVSAVLLARAQLLGSLYPFGAAILTAAAVYYKHSLPWFFLALAAGTFLAMPGSQMLLYLAVYAVLSLLLFFYQADGLKQWVILPCLAASVMLVAKGVFVTLAGGSSYLFMAGVFEALFAGGLTLVFLVFFQAMRRFAAVRRFTIDETICFFIIAAGVICGLSGWQIGGITLQDVAGRLLILAAAFLGGPGAGAACGAMVGIVPSLSTVVAPTLIASYAFSGLLAGLFANFGRIGAILGFILGNLILAIYLLSADQIALSLGASAAAALLFFLLPHRFYKFLKMAFSAAGLKSAREEKNERLMQLAVRRLKNAGWAFKDLSHSLAEIGEPMGAKDEGLQQVLDQLNRQVCGECSMKEICWEIDYSHSYRGILRLFSAVEKKGAAGVKDMPENFARRCPHSKELLAVVNCLYELYCRSNYWQEQRAASGRLLSGQMDALSDVLTGIAREITDFSGERELLDRELARALVKRNLPAENAGVGNISEKTLDIWVEYIQCPGEQICREGVEQEVSRLLNSEYSVYETSCEAETTRCRYRLLQNGARRVSLGKAQLAKDANGICGDCGGAILLGEGKQLLMVSDGMGIGHKAATESARALSLVSRLLEIGISRDTAIEMVNASMSLRGKEESFVTLDLCLLNLYDGSVEFIKTGGAPSFIKRGSEIKVIKGASLPVGILSTVERDVIEEKTQVGDVIIMASDGLSEAVGDVAWLSRLLQQAPSDDAQHLAEYLLDRAVIMSGGAVRDDITVLVAKIA